MSPGVPTSGRIAAALTLSVLLLPAVRGNSEIFEQPEIQFDVLLDVPQINRFETTLRFGRNDDIFVEVDASLRFDSRGRVVCNSDCTVDGVPVEVKGVMKRRNDRWFYKIVLRSTETPRTVVKAVGFVDDGMATLIYRGPKGKGRVRDAPVVLSPLAGPAPARVTLTPTVSGSGRITGAGRFPTGFGSEEELEGTLVGRAVGNFVKWTLKGRGRKLIFQGFLRENQVYAGTLLVRLPPEKNLVSEFGFPERINVAPSALPKVEKQKPFVLRFTFPLVDRRTNRPIRPGGDGQGTPPPTGTDFSVFEDSVLIDPLETNQFLTSNDVRPLEVVLILDYSRSMKDSIDAMVSAANSFLGRLGENASISVMGFWERQGGRGFISENEQPARYTVEEKLAFFDRLRRFDPGEHGASEIWDALDEALDVLPPPQSGVSQAVVFLSDGHDTSSGTSVDDIIRKSQARAVNFYPLGFNVRADVFPEDRKNLLRIARESGGAAFFETAGDRDVEQKLGRLFQVVSDKLISEWVLTYVTLKTSARHVVEVRSEYEFAKPLRLSHVFEVNDDLIGDIRQGILSLRPEVSTTPDVRRYALHANYVPRGVSRLRITVDVEPAEAVAGIELFEENGLLTSSRGWTAAADGDGAFLIVNESRDELEYGAFGLLLDVTVEGGRLLRLCVDDRIYIVKKTFVFTDTGTACADVIGE